ncbi:hypothetical protein [Bifidobacterium moukalabense]|uniref:hypothetical protein n=1 Tax=Bifidobacterium moukalabense TaxID=1333651 RepID=UPI0010F4FE1C|nr:hypothetical protein [Bifidobacterium moukalabense]
MAFKEKSTGKSNYEERLSMIARTAQWEFPDEITRFCDAMDKASDALGRAGTVLQEDGVFECSARDAALACSDRIVRNISDADFTAQAKRLRQRIETFNDVICEAQNVRLPGDKLSKESEQAIMNATEPMDWIVPGLGTVTGVMGIAGANLISRMLASNREEEAKKEYKRLMKKVGDGDVSPKPLPAVDVNGIWPAPSTDGSKDKAIEDSPFTNGSNGKGSGGGDGLSTIGAAGAGVGGGAAAAGVAAKSAVSDSANASATASSAGLSATGASSGTGRSSVSESGGSGSGSRSDGLVYDPATGRWVRRKDHMSVDSGMDGLNGAGSLHGGLGRTAMAASAGVGVGSTLAAGRLAGSGSSMGVLGGGAGGTGTAGLASLGGAGMGSYYANEPVRATAVSSSIKGATGMAAGLPKAGAASSAGAASTRGATPAMMGAGRGASSGKGGQRRNTLGYIAPTIEDDDEFIPKPLAAMAGHRKHSGE